MATTTATPPTEDLWFFNFYRQRLVNLRALGLLEAPQVANFPGSFDPDRFILVVAGLDSLAYHWDRLYQINTATHSERLGKFLLEYGDPTTFSKCSMPDLKARAVQEKRTNLLDALTRVPHANIPHATHRRWQQDPELRDLVANLAIVAAGADEDWLRRSRYGEILYKKFRCSWVHAFDGPGTAPPLFDVPADEPRYDNRNDQREIIFPLAFLLKSYSAAIESFAAKCIADGKNP